MFTLLDVRWTPRVNILDVACDCGAEFSHPVNRWEVKCPRCGQRVHVDAVRHQEPEGRRGPGPCAPGPWDEPTLPGMEGA